MTSTNHPKHQFSLSEYPDVIGWMAQSSAGSGQHCNYEAFEAYANKSDNYHAVVGPLYCGMASTPIHHDENSIVGIIIGKPEWQDPDLSEKSREQGHSAALIAAYKQLGANLTTVLKGSFGFVILDLEADEALIGIDRLGRHAMYYSHSDEGVLFGTSASGITNLRTDGSQHLNQGIYNYIYFHMIPSPTSIYNNINKLQAGCVAHIKDGSVNIRRYWQPKFREATNTTPALAYRELREHLKNAVANTVPSMGKVGAFLSGGLDSSSVAGMLSEVSESTSHAYSIGFAAEGYDEMAFARITADHFGIKLHEYYVTPEDVVEALPLIATSYDEPFGNSSALPAYFCAKMAKADNVDILLAGDGGDEIFAGNERYAKQKVFERYQGVPKWLRSGFVEPLSSAMPSWLPMADKTKSYIKQANIALPERLQTYNFLHQYDAEQVFQSNFLESVNTAIPLDLLREVFDSPEVGSDLNRMLFLDWQFTLADNDLRKVSHMCSLAGIKVAYPMLDDRLVEFSLSLPSDWKLKGNRLRDFYKKGLTNWLPDATITKPKQGFGLPFGVWMRTHTPLREMAYDHVLKLKTRKIFNNDFLDTSIKLHREGHASYFGELIWILTVLDMWLEEHG
jgi:asparagine synthase (glutamine-hydrolysing)